MNEFLEGLTFWQVLRLNIMITMTSLTIYAMAALGAVVLSAILAVLRDRTKGHE